MMTKTSKRFFELLRWAWIFPVVSCGTWWGMLIAMMSVWAAEGKPVYAFMSPDDTIAYISDVGASGIKALFIAGCAVEFGCFSFGICSERLLRARHMLAPNDSRKEVILVYIADAIAIAGQVFILMVSIFDTNHYHPVHVAMLVLFIALTGISCVLFVIEYILLERFYQIKRFRISYIFKAIWFCIALALVIAFGVLGHQDKSNDAAIVEWTLAFWYGFYILSISYDIWPAFSDRWISNNHSHHAFCKHQTSSQFDSASMTMTPPPEMRTIDHPSDTFRAYV